MLNPLKAIGGAFKKMFSFFNSPRALVWAKTAVDYAPQAYQVADYLTDIIHTPGEVDDKAVEWIKLLVGQSMNNLGFKHQDLQLVGNLETRKVLAGRVAVHAISSLMLRDGIPNEKIETMAKIAVGLGLLESEGERVDRK